MPKKSLSALLVLFLILGFAFSASAASTATATLTGPGAVRNYNTITLTFSLDSVAVTGVQGCIEYDPTVLTLLSETNVCDRDFELQTNAVDGKLYFVLYQRDASQKLFGNKKLFTLTFRVGANLQGKTLTVRAVNIVATNSQASISAKDAAYTCTVGKPVPYRTRLDALEISNGVLEPAFDPAQTEYTVTVGYDVANIAIAAVAANADSVVDVSSVTLAADTVTRLYVRVSASDVYTDYVINAFRQKSPDAELSSDTSVTAISLSDGRLSPEFDNAVSEYGVTVGADVAQLDVTVAMQDPAAYYIVNNNEKLISGHNSVEIVLIAADETSTRSIKLDVVREREADGAEKPFVFQGQSFVNLIIAACIFILAAVIVVGFVIRMKKREK